MTNALVPTTFDQAYRQAELISKNPFVPEYLRSNLPSCMEIVDRAMAWNMSAFAVAHCSFEVKGRIGYEGKLIAAACESTAALTADGFDFEYSGEGRNRKITVTATVRGQSKPRTVELDFENAHTVDKQGNVNKQWVKDVDQMLCYAGVRKWVRRWRPGVLLGVYSREELQSGYDIDGSPIIDVTAEGSAEDQAAASIAKAADDAKERSATLVRDYTFNLPEKSRTHGNPEDWIADWETAIARYVKADALDGLKNLMRLNLDAVAKVEAFDFKARMVIFVKTTDALEELKARRKPAAEPEKTVETQDDTTPTTPADDHYPRDGDHSAAPPAADKTPVQKQADPQADPQTGAGIVDTKAPGTQVATPNDPAAEAFLTAFKDKMQQEKRLGGLPGLFSDKKTAVGIGALMNRHPTLYRQAVAFCANPDFIEAVASIQQMLPRFYDDVTAKAMQSQDAA